MTTDQELDTTFEEMSEMNEEIEAILRKSESMFDGIRVLYGCNLKQYHVIRDDYHALVQRHKDFGLNKKYSNVFLDLDLACEERDYQEFYNLLKDEEELKRRVIEYQLDFPELSPEERSEFLERLRCDMILMDIGVAMGDDPASLPEVFQQYDLFDEQVQKGVFEKLQTAGCDMDRLQIRMKEYERKPKENDNPEEDDTNLTVIAAIGFVIDDQEKLKKLLSTYGLLKGDPKNRTYYVKKRIAQALTRSRPKKHYLVADDGTKSPL